MRSAPLLDRFACVGKGLELLAVATDAVHPLRRRLSHQLPCLDQRPVIAGQCHEGDVDRLGQTVRRNAGWCLPDH